MARKPSHTRANTAAATAGGPALQLAPTGDDAPAGGFAARTRRATARHLGTWWPVWLAFAVSRFGVVAVGLLSQYAAGGRSLPYVPFLEAGTFPHYVDVVTNGYTAANAYEFPLLPGLMWLGAQAGLPLTVASFLIVNAAFLVGLLAFASLGERYVGRTAAVRGATLLAIFPTAYAFTLASTESLMLATLCLAAAFAVRGNWLWAAPFAAACALTRPPAIFVGIVLLAIAVAQYRRRELPVARALVALAAAPVAVIGFFLYLKGETGDFMAAVHSQEQFGRHMSLDGPWRAVSGAVSGFLSADRVIGPMVELAAVALLIAAIYGFWKAASGNRADTPNAGATRSESLRAEVGGWVAFGAASLMLPLATGSVWQIPRFALLVPPAFWLLGKVVARRDWAYQSLLVLFPMALAVKLVFEVIGVTR